MRLSDNDDDGSEVDEPSGMSPPPAPPRKPRAESTSDDSLRERSVQGSSGMGMPPPPPPPLPPLAKASSAVGKSQPVNGARKQALPADMPPLAEPPTKKAPVLSASLKSAFKEVERPAAVDVHTAADAHYSEIEVLKATTPMSSTPPAVDANTPPPRRSSLLRGALAGAIASMPDPDSPGRRRSSLLRAMIGNSAAEDSAAAPAVTADPVAKRSSLTRSLFAPAPAELKKPDDPPPPPPRKQLWGEPQKPTDPPPPPRRPQAKRASDVNSVDGSFDPAAVGDDEMARVKALSPEMIELRRGSSTATTPPEAAAVTDPMKPSSLRSMKRSDSSPGAESSALLEAKLTLEQRRGKIVTEIYATELVYKNLLKDFREIFLAQLEVAKQTIAHDFLNRPKLAGLFANLEQIEHLSDQLISEMEAAFAQQQLPPARLISQGGKLHPSDARLASRVRVGHIFESIAKLLSLYEQYVDNHAYATDDIEDFAKDAKFMDTWKKIVKKQESLQSSSTATFQGYLILPIQRVPRYVLLLKELHTCTDKLLGNEEADEVEHRDVYAQELRDIKTALQGCTEAAQKMNETIRKSQSHQSMVALQSSMVNCKIDLLADGPLSDPRTVVKHGELVRVTQSSHKHKAFHFHLLTDMIIYSVPHARNGTFAFHRSFPFAGTSQGQSTIVIDDVAFGKSGGLDYAKDYERYVAYGASVVSKKKRASRLSGKWLPSESGAEAGAAETASRAFKIRFPGKDITLYAATEEDKKAWVKAIREQIAKVQSGTAGRQAMMSVFNKDDIERAKECQMCGEPISSSVIGSAKKKTVCSRCGLQVCKACSGRRRVLVKGEHPASCCDVCRLEMDLTPRDFEPKRFRMRLAVETVDGPVAALAKNAEDRAQPVERLFFNLTHFSESKSPLRRGNSSVGHQALFQIPVGPVQGAPDHDIWMLRLFMVRSGEVGSAAIDMSAVMCEPEMIRFQQCTRKFVIRPLQSASARVAGGGLSGAGGGGMDAGEAVMVSVHLELDVPPKLYVTLRELKDEQRRRARSISEAPSDSPSSPTRDGPASATAAMAAAAAGNDGDDSERESEEARAGEDKAALHRRLRCFEQPGLRAAVAINKALLIEYETHFLDSPSYLRVVCVDYLLGHCIRRVAELALPDDARRATLLNRLRLFHHHPVVAKVIAKARLSGEVVAASPELADISPRTSPRTVHGHASVPRQPAAVAAAAAAVMDSPAANRYFSHVGSDGGSAAAATAAAPGGAMAADDKTVSSSKSTELSELYTRRQQVLEELLKSEEDYVRRLNLLSDVFVAPLMHVANGASVSTVLKDIDGDGEGRVTARDRYETRIVAEFVRARYVTVLLQSVRQILTVNTQLMGDLKKAISDDGAKPVCVGHIFKRFAVVIKVYATFRTAYPEVVKDIDDAPAQTTQLQSGGGQVKDLVFATTGMGRSVLKRLAPSEHEPLSRDRVLKQFLERLAGDKQSFAKHLGVDADKWKTETFLGLIRAPNDRIQAYKRFLSALLINTPETDPPHPDAVDLRLSLQLLNDADKQITQAGKLKNIYKELKSIEAILFNTPKRFHVGDSPSRRLLKQGYLVKRCRREDKLFYFWLFNDSLVYAHDRANFSGTFNYNRDFHLADIGFQDKPKGIEAIGANLGVLSSLSLASKASPGDPKYAFTILRYSPHKSMDLMIPNALMPALDDKDFGDVGVRGREATPLEKQRLKDEWARAFMGCELGINVGDDMLSDGNVAPSWQSDKLTAACTQCRTKFTFFNRRHHCRKCGEIFCGKCSSHKLDMQKKSNEANFKPKRVCDACYKTYGPPGGAAAQSL